METTAARFVRRAIVSPVLPIVLVASALGLTSLLSNVVSTAGFIFFYAAVSVSAWFGQGWFAVILSAFAVAYFFTPPLYSFTIDRHSIPLFIEFAASALIIGWFSSWRKRAETELKESRDLFQKRVEERTAELRQTNEQLLSEIAERRRAEDAYYEASTELARVNRKSALGALAASISHEINQPLAAVVTNADACAIWLSADPPNIGEGRAAVECIVREGSRASAVVRRIRALFANSTPERLNVDVNESIRSSAVLLDAELSRHRVALEIHCAPGLRPVLGDPVQIQQVLVNLAMNGIESMVSVDNGSRILEMRAEPYGAEQVRVSVRDTGSGIATKDQRRIFDAFYTTKAQGMGMGLSICQSIVESHGGRLSATPNPDRGTTFQFTLPTVGENYQ